MTVNSPPYALQAGSHSAQLFRQATFASFAAAGGVLGTGDYLVTQNGTPNMSVNVAGGAPGSGGGILVPGTTTAGVQGLYYGFNDGTVNLAIAASNPTNPRIDVVCAQVQDAAYAGAVNSFSVAVVTGTPAGSPVAPSVPASSLSLATVAVAALATTVVTGNITDTRISAASAFPELGLATYKTVLDKSAEVIAANTGGGSPYVFGGASVNLIKTGAGGSIDGFSSVFYYDPADYAITGKTTKLRLRISYVSNTTRSGQSTTIGLYPVTSSANGVLTLGAIQSGSSIVLANPLADTLNQGNSGDFTAPAAGYYALGLLSAGWTAGAIAAVRAQLQVREV